MENHSSDSLENGPTDELSVEEMWTEAARNFEELCGNSLQMGKVKSFEDVQREIESSDGTSLETSMAPENGWAKAKKAGLATLPYLKILVETASEAAGFVPIPEAAVNLTGKALCFVFDIPQTIQDYSNAVDSVFSQVSMALSQFQIYRSMDKVDNLLVKQIHRVLVSFVKLCAHVVKYRQGRKRDRFWQKTKSIFENDSGLGAQISEFRQALQTQHILEGTVMLRTLVVTKDGVEHIKKGVDSINDDTDRIKTLVKIRDTLDLWPAVRLDSKTTQTCTNIFEKCLPSTGLWICSEDSTYTAWTSTTKSKGADATPSNVLIVSGPPSSGKSSVSARITKYLEEKQQCSRTYVAHYFFTARDSKGSSSKNPVQTALKYMAFQLARVDVVVRKALSKSCNDGAAAFRHATTTPKTLDDLWKKLSVTTTGSGATYYLVFDGLETLPDGQAKTLLQFAFDLRQNTTQESTTSPRIQIRVLVSGTDEEFKDLPAVVINPLRIQMEEHSEEDMRHIIEDELSKQGILQNAKSEDTKKNVIDKLPQKANGSFSLLQSGLANVISLLSSRRPVGELDKMLNQSTSSHEVAIDNLQRSLNASEIEELNEMLKWVLFSQYGGVSLETLEGAMWLHSQIESPTTVEDVIKKNYASIFEIDDGFVTPKTGIMEYLETRASSRASASKTDRATISMTIQVTNTDRELCGRFLWDLADMAIHDKFKFDHSSDMDSAWRSSIGVRELEAHRSIVMQAFRFLRDEPREDLEEVGIYIVFWLPYHLNKLRQLDESNSSDELTSQEKRDIGQQLYELFKDDTVFQRHKSIFEQTYWNDEEIRNVQEWFMDQTVVKRLDKTWVGNVQQAPNPVRGYLVGFVKMVIRGLLLERSWDVEGAWDWLDEFMSVENEKHRMEDDAETRVEDPDKSSSTNIDWNRVSMWCQEFLQLPESELNSLWYERLADASSKIGKTPSEITISFYEKAIQQKDPSWLCYYGLGTMYHDVMDTAISYTKKALEEANKIGALPKPEPKDIANLHLLLGKYAFETGDVPLASENYTAASNCNDAEKAAEGRSGILKVNLSLPDVEETRNLLGSMLAPEDDNGKSILGSVLSVVAQEASHDATISILFSRVREDQVLCEGLIHAMKAATGWGIECNTSSTEEGVTRGVLLYDLGVAAYNGILSKSKNDSINEALQLWTESRKQLDEQEDSIAYDTRLQATSALANHYFQTLHDDLDSRKSLRWDYMKELKGLGGAELEDDSLNFWSILHALASNEDEAMEALRSFATKALQTLSDGIPGNDIDGFLTLFRVLVNLQDFVSAAISQSLTGHPDLVVEALCMDGGRQGEEEDAEEKDEDKQLMLIEYVRLATETIQATKAEVPNVSEQVQRIKVAKKYAESLLKNTPEGHASDDGKSRSAHERAIDLLQSRLKTLEQRHTPEIDFGLVTWMWCCDGRALNGKKCSKRISFDDDMFHCIYCANRDFCLDCLKRLREGESDMLMGCSSKHRWIRMPRLGDDIYAGPGAKNVWIPSAVEALDGDNQILAACYTDTKMVSVDEWTMGLAEEWNISLSDMNNDESEEDISQSDMGTNECGEGSQGDESGEEPLEAEEEDDL